MLGDMRAFNLVIMLIMLAGCSASVNLDPAALEAPFVGSCAIDVTTDYSVLCGVPVDSCVLKPHQDCSDSVFDYGCAGGTLTASF